MEKHRGLKKACRIAANVLLYIFIFTCLFGVILTITAKKDSDGTVTVLGRQMRIVLSSSMEKCDTTDVSEYDIKDIPVKSMVFIETVPEDPDEAMEWYANLEIGDVLTFKYVYVRQETITHRITGIDKKADGYVFRLEGDNKNSDANTLTQTIDTSVEHSPNYVVGKVTGQSYLLGVFITALKTPIGIVSVVIIPATIILIYEILKVVKILSEGRLVQAEEERLHQQVELDELRRRLAELEARDAKASAPPPDKTVPPGAENGPSDNSKN